MTQEKYKKIATDWLRDHLKSFKGPFHAQVKKFKSDYRMGSVAKTATLYCEAGGLYTTSPENPAQHIQVKSLVGNKVLAKFAIEEIAKDL